MLKYVLGPSPPHSVIQEMAPGFTPAESISMANKSQSKVRVSYSSTTHVKSQQLHEVTCSSRIKQNKTTLNLGNLSKEKES